MVQLLQAIMWILIVWGIFTAVVALGFSEGYAVDSPGEIDLTEYEYESEPGDSEITQEIMETIMPPLMQLASLVAMVAFYISFVVPRPIINVFLQVFSLFPLIVFGCLVYRARGDEITGWVNSRVGRS